MKRRLIRIMVILVTIITIASIINTNSYAGVDIPNSIITGMKAANNGASGGTSSHTAEVINNIIGLIQAAGSGIALIVIALMGIKYMLAAPSEKADTKKMIMPVIIGCVLLFGAANLAAIIENFATTTLPNN